MFCIISAATKAAITSGRLSGRPAAPIGQTSGPISGAGSSDCLSQRRNDTSLVFEPIIPT